MEIVFGGIAALIATVLLAAVGLTTVVALGLMMGLGLLTEMSFKRLFFVSFGMALVAPLLVGGALFSAIEDGTIPNDLRASLEEVANLPVDHGGDWEQNWQEAFREIGEIGEIGEQAERGEISEE